ncbi:unnamed protein product [Ilex paraguariensis]|uniref:non-specific serine/threonine protein kinase n=1 Tax=Ilex paraguariensis TaxID=185542 RepID=A0ABC8SPR9_9AQUA
MHPNLFMIMIGISIFSHLPMFLCQDNEQYTACGELSECANIQGIGYPFWGQNRLPYCGHPHFRLNCQGDAPIITILSMDFRVLAIDNKTQTLTVARQDLWNNICPIFLYNTTMDFNIFGYSIRQRNISLHYGCTRFPVPLKNQFLCNVNDTPSSSYFTMGETPNFVINNTTITCNSNVIVPVNETSTEILSSLSATTNNLTAALDGGFQLQWDANNMYCTQCNDSGGRCGSDSSNTSFACYCLDGSYARTCRNTDQTGKGKTHLKSIPVAVIAVAFAVGIGILVATVFCFRRKFALSKTDKFKNVKVFLKSCGSIALKRICTCYARQS